MRIAALVGGPVGGGGRPGVARQVQAQVGGAAQTAAVGDVVDREVADLEQAAGFPQPRGGEPAPRRHACLGHEPASERTGRPAGVPGQVGDGQRLGQVFQRPVAGGRQALGRRRHGALQQLSLPAVAVRGDDHVAGDADGGIAAEVGTHQLHAQVDASGQPGAGQHAALVHPQPVRVDLDRRMPRRQLGRVLPVRGGPAVVEQAGRGQGERPGAHRDHAGATRGRLAQR